MHNGDKESTLDCSVVLDLGFAIFLVLSNKVLSITPPKAKSELLNDSSLMHSLLSLGKSSHRHES